MLSCDSDKAVEEFRSQLREGRRPEIGEFLPSAGDNHRALLLKLIPLDMRDRLHRGEAARVEDYLNKFALLSEDHDALLELIAAEFQFRRLQDEDVSDEEILRRFPDLVERNPDEASSEGFQTIASTLATRFPLGVLTSTEGFAQAGRQPHAFSIDGFEILEGPLVGGMGFIYKAWDKRRSQFVAIKGLQRVDPFTLPRFKQEFRALAELSHPNLVQLYELICQKGDWHLTMEWIEGKPFVDAARDQVDQTEEIEGSPPSSLSDIGVERLRELTRDLAKGIHFLHENSRLHRDLKPSNVLVTRQDRVVILDFGLAAELPPVGAYQSVEHHCLGTAAYMAPEQAASQPVAPAADWYSFGVILFECLTGRRPFDGSPLLILQSKQQKVAPAVREFAANVPEDLDQLCSELLRTDPAERPVGEEILRRLAAPTPESSTSEVLANLDGKSSGVFVGRIKELRELAKIWEEARSGATQAVFVRGEAGQGKTTLVRSFLESLGPEPLVLAGRCYERESSPYKAVDGIIEALARHLMRIPAAQSAALFPRDCKALCRVFPAFSKVRGMEAMGRDREGLSDPQECRRRAFLAFRELLCRLGDASDVVLFTDDLQWGDADSARLMIETIRPTDSPRLLWIGSFRATDGLASPFLTTWNADEATSKSVRGFTLEPLSADECRELVACTHSSVPDQKEWQRHGDYVSDSPQTRDEEDDGIDGEPPRGPLGETILDSAVVDRIVEEAAGSPLHLLQLIEHARFADAEADCRDLSIAEVVGRRVERLDDAARHLLELIAACGGRCRWDVVFHAAGSTGEEESAMLRLRQARLVRGMGSTGELVDVYHDRVRETILDRMDSESSLASHRALAEAFLAYGVDDPETLATHLENSGELEASAVEFARAAQRATESLAFDQAARFFHKAINLKRWPSNEEEVLRRGHAQALANLGRGVDAANELRDIADRFAPEDAVDLRCKAGQLLLYSGEVRSGLEELREVAQSTGVRVPRGNVSLWSTLLWRLVRERCSSFVPSFYLGPSGRRRHAQQADVNFSLATGLLGVDPLLSAACQLDNFWHASRARDDARWTRALAVEVILGSMLHAERKTKRWANECDRIAVNLGDDHSIALGSMARGVHGYLVEDFSNAYAFLTSAIERFQSRCVGAAWEVDFSSWAAIGCGIVLGKIRDQRMRLNECISRTKERGSRFYQLVFEAFAEPYCLLFSDETVRATRMLERLEEDSELSKLPMTRANVYFLRSLTSLYLGDAERAMEVSRVAARFVRANFLATPVFGTIWLDQRASACLARYAQTGESGLLSRAKRYAKRLIRCGRPWARALGVLRLSAFTYQKGDVEMACHHLAAAASLFHVVGAEGYCAVAHFRLGQLTEGEEAAKHLELAQVFQQSEGIVSMDRVARMYAPGLEPKDRADRG